MNKINLPLHYKLFLRYLLRTGGVVYLNFSKDIWEKLNEEGKKKFFDALASREEIFNFIEINDELFYSVGKVRIAYDEQNSRAFLVDYYIFYPICRRVYEHFHGCNCSNKVWSSYKIQINLNNFVQKILKILNFNIDISIYNSKITFFSILVNDKIEIRFSDWFVHKLGKPFWTICEIPLEEVKL